ncbi:MAG: GDP-mannose 4,6-dehydratase, partial [Thermoplasmata archaeon]
PLQLGNPDPTRDYTYVEDIVKGYVALAERGKNGEIYHFCSGKERSVKDIVETIMELSGGPSKVSWSPGLRKVDILRSVGSYEKARKDLGWEPMTTFEDGIRKTIEWYRSATER